MKKGVLCLFAAGVLCLAGNVASASLIGDTIDVELEIDGNLLIDESVVVGGGAEINETFGDITLEVTVDAQSGAIQVAFQSSAGMGAGVSVEAGEFRFTDLDWLPVAGTLTNATIQSNTQMLPLTLSFTGDSVTLEFDAFELSGPQEAVVRIDLEAEHAIVPEPATFGLFALGLAGIAIRSRQRLA